MLHLEWEEMKTSNSQIIWTIIIDYAFDEKNKSDILDLFLHKKSNFIISNGGITNFRYYIS